MYKKAQKSPNSSEEEPIIVRIWDADKGTGQVGHASLEIGESYLSFWPRYEVSLQEKPGKIASTEAFLNSYQEDVYSEGKLPDHIYHVTTLDRSRVIEAIEEIKEEVEEGKIGYCLSGRAFLGGKSCMNCTTAVFDILKKGGFKHMPVLDDTLTSPNGLHDIMEAYQKYEPTYGNQSNQRL